MRTRAISLSFIAVLALVATALLFRAERTTTPRATPTAGASQDADRGETITATGELPRRFQGAPAREQGAVERVDYQTRYDDRSIDKHALVYLPAGYDQQDPGRRYDVLYLMHGAGMNTDSFFAGPGQRSALKTMVDHMIEAEEIKPLIVVTPSFYPDANSSMDLHYAGQLDRDFHQELGADLMPAVEGRYHTYAEITDAAGFRASRTHRGFAGFSMGGVTTWYTFINSLDYFKYFMPMAGDCWVIEDVGGARAPEETAAFLAGVARDSGYGRDDYVIAASVGSIDGTIGQMQPQIDAMRKLTGSFDAGNDGNLRFITDPGGGHDFASLYRQFEQSIRLFV